MYFKSNYVEIFWWTNSYSYDILFFIGNENIQMWLPSIYENTYIMILCVALIFATNPKQDKIKTHL